MDAICQGCEKKADDGFNNGELIYHYWARNDAYGLYTGLYCDECYNSDKYPYRKDEYYDPAYAGERMDEDY
jgi:hypothetical protein